MAIEMKIELSASSFPGQMRRPNPKAMLWGSCSGLSPKKRSGLNSDGFLKAFGSCVNHLHVMYRSALHCEGEKGYPYHMFGNTMDPFGMKYPLNVLSSEAVCGTPTTRIVSKEIKFGYRSMSCLPRGVTGFQRNVSFTSASMYGRCARSPKLGRRSPITRSSSACAVFWTSGNSVIARKKVYSADTVWQSM